MDSSSKATRINLFDFTSIPMRAFHVTWLAFFVCFFAWFGIAPLTAIVRDELQLTPAQVGNTIIASVAITVIARLFIGWLCDRYGPRLTYTWLLVIGAIPVIGIGLANNYTSFLLFRLAIGAIGASFVITQYHTSLMFAPNCVGTANATTAGWGNLGGGVTQITMPAIFALFISMGMSSAMSWRVAMIVPGIAMIAIGLAYWRFTKDTPEGNFSDLCREGKLPAGKKSSIAGFIEACSDSRVWILALIYGASFGLEITIHNIAAVYFKDTFAVSLKVAGLIAGSFGLLAIFARSLGGFLSDKISLKHDLRGRVLFLGAVLFCQGVMMVVFSRSGMLTLAVISLIVFGLFVHVACGATYAIIPFVNRRAVGSVAGVVGAGGNIGAVASGFLFKGDVVTWASSLQWLGIGVAACAFLALLVKVESVPAKVVSESPAAPAPIQPA